VTSYGITARSAAKRAKRMITRSAAKGKEVLFFSIPAARERPRGIRRSAPRQQEVRAELEAGNAASRGLAMAAITLDAT